MSQNSGFPRSMRHGEGDKIKSHPADIQKDNREDKTHKQKSRGDVWQADKLYSE